jgi:hypothetical protein
MYQSLHRECSLQPSKRLGIQVLPATISTATSSQSTVVGFDMVGVNLTSWANGGVRMLWFNPFDSSMPALGWADFRITSYEQIEKWWELVMSAFLMVSLFADQFNNSCPLAHQQFVQHPWWDNQSGWKN